MHSHDESVVFSAFVPADDGVIARIRVPGGRVRAAQWEGLADLSEGFGDGHLYLTSRGNLQIRGVRDQEEVASQLAGLGLGVAPSVMCSPLSSTLMALVDALVPHLPVSGPVVGIDVGDGAILAKDPDVGLLAQDGGARFHLVVGGEPTGLVVSADSVVEVVKVVVAYGGDAVGFSSQVGGLVTGEPGREIPRSDVRPAPIGWMQDGDAVMLGAGLREGRMGAQLARFLAAIETDIRITPWRSVVIHGLSDGVADQVVKVLAPMGLIFDANSPWLSD